MPDTAAADVPIYFLAFDHRGAFARAVFDAGTPLDARREREIADAKALIFDGLARVQSAGGLPHGRPGILVDELYGSDVARAAKAAGVVVAMPVELPDQDVFAFAYGDRWRAHVEAFEPDFAKVLVRYNPDGRDDDNAVQRVRLRELSGWLHDSGRRFLFELVIEPTAAQLAACGGDRDAFATTTRPRLICRAIAQLQEAGVEPHVWKIEGIDAIGDAHAVVAQARADERAHVVCTVLGAGAGDAQVGRWLRTAAAVDGFAGFAIGRSIWREAVRDALSGRLTREAAAEQIAARYLEFVRVGAPAPAGSA